MGCLATWGTCWQCTPVTTLTVDNNQIFIQSFEGFLKNHALHGKNYTGWPHIHVMPGWCKGAFSTDYWSLWSVKGLHSTVKSWLSARAFWFYFFAGRKNRNQTRQETDGQLAFPWERFPERQQMMKGQQGSKESVIITISIHFCASFLRTKFCHIFFLSKLFCQGNFISVKVSKPISVKVSKPISVKVSKPWHFCFFFRKKVCGHNFHIAKARISSGPWASSAPKRRSKSPSKRNSCSAPNEFELYYYYVCSVVFFCYVLLLSCCRFVVNNSLFRQEWAVALGESRSPDSRCCKLQC